VREPAAAEVAAAASAAAAAFAAESRRRTFSDAELLRRVADALEERRTDVCGVAERETGLDSDRLQGELTRTTGQLAAFAGLADSGAWLDPILDRADPLCVERSRPAQQLAKASPAGGCGELRSRGGGEDVDRAAGVGLLVGVRPDHDHVARPFDR